MSTSPVLIISHELALSVEFPMRIGYGASSQPVMEIWLRLFSLEKTPHGGHFDYGSGRAFIIFAGSSRRLRQLIATNFIAKR